MNGFTYLDAVGGVRGRRIALAALLVVALPAADRTQAQRRDAAGVSLEQTQQSIRSLGEQQGMPAEFGERLGRLAASVYASKDEAPKFRAGLFYHCVVEPSASR